MILSKVEKNKTYVVKNVKASPKDKLKLFKLGIYLKSKIYLLNKIAGGGVIVCVLGSDVVIGKNVASKIEVEKC